MLNKSIFYNIKNLKNKLKLTKGDYNLKIFNHVLIIIKMLYIVRSQINNHLLKGIILSISIDTLCKFFNCHFDFFKNLYD